VRRSSGKESFRVASVRGMMNMVRVEPRMGKSQIQSFAGIVSRWVPKNYAPTGGAAVTREN